MKNKHLSKLIFSFILKKKGRKTMKDLGTFKDKKDGSIKSVFQTEDNKIIEMTLLFNKEKLDVVCAPTHHFCNLGCKMCHLTNNKLNKKMIPITTNNFIEGLIKTTTKDEKERFTDKDRLLISFMGVGEPLLNLKLIEEIYDREEEIKKTLGYKEISYALATMMPNNNIEKLEELVIKKKIPLKIHFSMHTPIDEDRKKLIPSTNVSVEEALNYLNHYRQAVQQEKEIIEVYKNFHRTIDPVEIHYTLIENVNDTAKELEKACELLKKYRIPIKFIRFNPINELKRSENETIWLDIIKRKVPGLRVKTYSPPGRDIGSSCGEFTKHYYHEEIETEEEKIEFQEWKETFQIDKTKEKTLNKK